MSAVSKKRKSPGRPISNNAKIINPNRPLPAKGAANFRDKSTIKRLAMYKERPRYTAEGEFRSGKYMSRTVDERIKRVEPNRRWFGNTRVIKQEQLTEFREKMTETLNDPYKYVLKHRKLPMGLLSESTKTVRMDLLQTESFEDAFGKQSKRKRPRLGDQFGDVESLMGHVQGTQSDYNSQYDPDDPRNKNIVPGQAESAEGGAAAAASAVDCMAGPNRGPHGNLAMRGFDKGQSKRIWSELYKVIDTSDVVVQVLDARDPMGTRCKRIEDELKGAERRHKHMVLLLNKCDLVPPWVTQRYVTSLSKEYPTLAFHASITNPFGKGALIQLLRQFSHLHKDRRQITVGFVGYPNVGKSSVINSLRSKKVCEVAPNPGETKLWRHVSLFKRVTLIDCPGVVYAGEDNSEVDLVMKNVIRVESLPNPEDFAMEIVRRVRPIYLTRSYGITDWKDPEDFLEQFCRNTGKFLPGGEADLTNGSRMILHDWQRGRLPFFVAPPTFEDPTKTLPDEDGDESDDEQSSTAGKALAAAAAAAASDEEEKSDAEADEDQEEGADEEEEDDDEGDFFEGSDNEEDGISQAGPAKRQRMASKVYGPAPPPGMERSQVPSHSQKRKQRRQGVVDLLHVEQNFSGILVKPEFVGEDIYGPDGAAGGLQTKQLEVMRQGETKRHTQLELQDRKKKRKHRRRARTQL